MANMDLDPLAPTRDCRVSFTDRQGVTHSVNVRATSRYQAFGLALHVMRQCSWSQPDYAEVLKMTIELRDTRPPQRIVVTRQQFEDWLNQPRIDSDRPRRYVAMLLGRMEPDREFKRGHGRH
jgi:hypothetical protein